MFWVGGLLLINYNRQLAKCQLTTTTKMKSKVPCLSNQTYYGY